MRKKPMIIVGLIFGLIITALIVYLVLTLTTDIFKPTSELFQRYLKQGVKNTESLLDISKEKDYLNTLINNNYRDNTLINISYKNSKNNDESFTISSDGIINNSEQNSYRAIELKYNQDYSIFKTEYLKEKNTYGLLFSNVVKQFVSADIEDFESFLGIIGIEVKDIKKDKYLEILDLAMNKKDNIKNAVINYILKLNNNKFSKRNSIPITLNNGEEKITKAYYLKLSKENTKELVLEILKSLDKQEEINKINSEKTTFPELDMVLYTLDGNLIRINIEVEKYQIRLDYNENMMIIKFNIITDQDLKTVNLGIKKEGQGKEIDFEDSYNNKVNIKYNFEEATSAVKTNIELKISNDYINGIEVNLNQSLEVSNTAIEGIIKKFDNKTVNVMKLNENDRNSALSSLIERIDSLLIKQNNQINSELLNMWIQFNKELENKYKGIKEKQIKEFNNQFLPYKGQFSEKEIIYNLLDLAGRNMEKYEQIGEDTYRIYLEQRKRNEEMSEELKKKFEKEGKKYNISLGYDSEGKINTLIIRVYKQ